MATWYVRPDTSHNTTRNGTSYATAWGGWGEIVAGSMAATDTLMVCGAHSYSDATKVTHKTGTSTSARFIYDGGYAADPGSIAFSGSAYLVTNNSNVSLRNLTITGNGVFHNANKINVDYTGCEFSGGAYGVAVGATNNGVTTGITFDSCDFHDFTGTGQSGAISLLIYATGANYTATGWTITDCTFHDCTASDNVIHIRSESDTTAVSFGDITISGCSFEDCRGFPIRIVNDAGTPTNGAVTITDNIFTNCTEQSAGNGGNQIYGTVITISGNMLNGVHGAGGGFNVFYGTEVMIEDNHIEDVTTGTIDGNGILIDHGNDNVTVRRNTIKNCTGKSGVSNSGCGVMILDATNVQVYSNTIEGGRVGLWVSQANGKTQSAQIHHNTVVGPTVYGMYVGQYATRAAIVAKNNVFTGSVPFVYDQTTGGWTGEDYNVVYGMTASTNHTDGAHNITSDPLLSSDYKPSSASPCIGAGVYVLPGATDYRGLAFRHDAPSIGAFEMHPMVLIQAP